MSTISTKRLLLRPYANGDREVYISLVTDPQVMEHVDEGVVTKEVAAKWWGRLIGGETKGVRWCVRTLDGERYVGHGMINQTRPGNAFELGYILAEREWNNGFATEIAVAIADYSRDIMNLNEIFATVDEGHEASVKVLEKTGMEFFGYDSDEDGRYLVYILRHE